MAAAAVAVGDGQEPEDEPDGDRREQSSACFCSEVAECKASAEQRITVAVGLQGFSGEVEYVVFLR